MSDSTPNIDQYKGNTYIAPDEVLELHRRITQLQELCVIQADQIARLKQQLKTCCDNCAMHERNETTAVKKHFALLERLESLQRLIGVAIEEARDE